MKRYDKIWRYFLHLWHITIPLAIAGILYDSLMSLVPILEGKAIDSVGNGDSNGVLIAVLSYFLLVIFVQVNRFLKRFLVRIFSNRMNYMMKEKSFRHLLSMDMSYFDANPLGDILNKNTSDVSATCESVRKMTTEVFDTIILMIGYLVTYFMIDYKIALMTIPFIFLSMGLSVILKRRIYDASKERKEYASHFKERTLGLLENGIYLKGIGVSDRYDEKYDDEIKTMSKKNARSLVYEGSMEYIYSSIAYLGLAFIILFGISNMRIGKFDSIGTFTSLLTTYLLLARKGAKVGKTVNAFQGFKVTYVRIRPFLADDDEELVSFESDDSGLCLRNFSFGYEGYKLPMINASFGPHDTIGVVGRVHSGKSTLLKGLTGLYEYDGECIIDGLHLRDVQHVGEQLVSYYPNEKALFKDTMRNNVTLGRDGDFDKAIEISMTSSDFVDYEMVMNPSLTNISGGQTQRVMLARALYAPTRMMLLDNPFSSLEKKMSYVIFDDLKKIDSIKLIVTNDKEMLSKTDKIIFLDGDDAIVDSYEGLMCNKEFSSLMEAC